MLLKMNRCSVTRRCLLGENKNKKEKEDTMLPCLFSHTQFTGKIGEWCYERRSNKAGITDINIRTSGAQEGINGCNKAKSSKCKHIGVRGGIVTQY
jgi:hypothetical protein